ncbi:MAG: hypothetical protein QNJ15_04830 [Erythrobacter sp.]|nr:hypothetical protein [Erythrobacter sp.]
MPLSRNRTFFALVFSVGLALGGGPSAAQDAPAATTVSSERDAQRLRTAQGISLQWIDWDRRGDVHVARGPDGVWRINGVQRGNGGRLAVDGVITEIGEDHFLMDGRIVISNAPGRGRLCMESKVWRFEVTQNRTYYRLREFEWCDRLTDYIDIYFAPRLRA